jgi:GntR family transcriptional regulator of vanillate catabolism
LVFTLVLDQITGISILDVYSAYPVNAPPSHLAQNPAEPSEAGASQAVKAQLRLREMLLGGDLPGGTRIAEVAVSEMLGVSRTPVRTALMRLEQEGLLEALPGGGYAVRTFSERDAADAIELRGTLEGLAARLAAERGAPQVVLREARACLRRIDELLHEPALDDAAFSRYVAFNEEFHHLLSELSGSLLIAQQIERVISLPFASPSGFVVVQANSPAARDMFLIAQDQHWQVLDAIENREGARAEALMREHSRIARRNLSEALHGGPTPTLPGVQLIRRRH